MHGLFCTIWCLDITQIMFFWQSILTISFLCRILLMMQTVASHKAVNRMSSSAVAACMAPLLLRPLLAGECEIDNDFDVGGDGSIQLLQAAAAANHAQAIVITLLEEYNSIFGVIRSLDFTFCMAPIHKMKPWCMHLLDSCMHLNGLFFIIVIAIL